jgi:hypothetical protein
MARVSGERLDLNTSANDKQRIKNLIKGAEDLTDLFSNSSGDGTHLHSTILSLQRTVKFNDGSLIGQQVAKLNEAIDKEIFVYEEVLETDSLTHIMFNLEKMLLNNFKLLIRYIEETEQMCRNGTDPGLCFKNRKFIKGKPIIIKNKYLAQLDMLNEITAGVKNLFAQIHAGTWDDTFDGRKITLPYWLIKSIAQKAIASADKLQVIGDDFRFGFTKGIRSCLSRLVSYMDKRDEAVYPMIRKYANMCLEIYRPLIPLLAKDIGKEYNTFSNIMNVPMLALTEEKDNINRIYRSMRVLLETLQSRLVNLSAGGTSLKSLIHNAGELYPYLSNWERASKLDIYHLYGKGNLSLNIGAKEEMERTMTDLKAVAATLKDVETYTTKLVDVIASSLAKGPRGNISMNQPGAPPKEEMPKHYKAVNDVINRLEKNKLVQSYNGFLMMLKEFYASLELTEEFYRYAMSDNPSGYRYAMPENPSGYKYAMPKKPSCPALMAHEGLVIPTQ